MQVKKRAVFLDRDGVINVDKAYVHKVSDFEFCEGVFEALKNFQALGYLLIIVTNQSGIGRGYYKEEDFKKLTDWMLKEFEKRGIDIANVYYCPHHPNENCLCRKPNNQMLEDALKDFDLDMKKCWMIGDKQSDIEAAKKSGIINTILLTHSNTDKKTDAKYKVNSIFDTISIIR